MQTSDTLSINPRLDLDSLRDAYRAYGRVQVKSCLQADAADRIHRCLTTQQEWNLVYRAAGRHVDSAAQAIAKWPRARQRKLDKIIHRDAQLGFQYRYRNVPIYDIYHQKQLPGHFFNGIFRFLNSEPFLEMVRNVCDDQEIAFADAQATRFDAGDFLTSQR